ncbi:hypothetical protein PENSPDRAFT_95812 [Peniophora sp. CONT]|nr:hypothetical protein PENSPDRAFT_95812 [Peniophora sp. CONT]
MQRVMTMFKYLESFNTSGDAAGYVHYMDAIYDLSDILVYAINQNLHSYLHKNGSKFLEEEAPPISTRWLGLFYRFHCMAGLDPSYSKAEYENHREQICDWQRCRHSWEPATDKKLKLCRGCGVARYCGPDCQRLDWKEGRHKEMCGKRIKDH